MERKNTMFHSFKKHTALAGALLLSLSLAACSAPADSSSSASSALDSKTDQTLSSTAASSGSAAANTDREAVEFSVTVIHPDGSETEKSYTSDAEYLAEPLVEDGLIEGEEGEYGLYVTTVDGIRADYEKDGSWWKLLVNGEESQVGVSSCPIEAGAVYTWEYVQ